MFFLNNNNKTILYAYIMNLSLLNYYYFVHLAMCHLILLIVIHFYFLNRIIQLDVHGKYLRYFELTILTYLVTDYVSS